MPRITFTANLLRHVESPVAEVEGGTVREALESYFEAHPQVRGYVLDDQGTVRKHVTIFHNGEVVQDRVGLSDPVAPQDGIFVAQALSGG